MLRGKKILITSGPTRMPLDAIRYLSNISTGRFGTLLAKKALKKGASVTFVYGKGSFSPRFHRRLKCVEVKTNNDLSAVLKTHLKKYRYDVLIHAMAVLDFQPSKIWPRKTKTKQGSWVLRLVPTPKIINQIKKWDPKIVLVGFKLEVGVSKKTLFASARRLLKQSKADFIVANQLTEGADAKHAGFLLSRIGNLIARAKGKKNLAKLIISALERGTEPRW